MSSSLRHLGRTSQRSLGIKHVTGAIIVAALSVATVGSFLTPTALGAYHPTIQNTQNTQASGYFTCNQAVRMDNAYLSYGFDSVNSPQTVSQIPNLAPNGPTGTGSYAGSKAGSGDPDRLDYFADTPTACVRDTGYLRFTNPSNRTYSSFVNGPSNGFPAGLTSNNLTQELWFRTAANYNRGGALMSLGDKNFVRADSANSTKLSNGKDHQFFMDTSGYIRYVVWTGSEVNLRSPTTLNDGNWHHLVATTSTTTGMALWVDGQRVAGSSTNVGSTTSNAGNVTYLHIGYDNLNGWTGAPPECSPGRSTETSPTRQCTNRRSRLKTSTCTTTRASRNNSSGNERTPGSNIARGSFVFSSF